MDVMVMVIQVVVLQEENARRTYRAALLSISAGQKERCQLLY
jgi:hypothetical protein